MTGAGKTFMPGLVVGFVTGTVADIFLVRSPLWPLRKETRAVRDARVLTMTSEQFPVRCGKLISDKLTHSASLAEIWVLGSSNKYVPSDERDVTVTVILPDGTSQNVTAVFDKVGHIKPRWKLISVGEYTAQELVYSEVSERLRSCIHAPPSHKWYQRCVGFNKSINLDFIVVLNIIPL